MYRNFPMISRVVYGRGCFDQLDDILAVKRQPGRDAMVFVVDDVFDGAALAQRVPVRDSDVLLWANVDVEPKTSYVDEMTDLARAAQNDLNTNRRLQERYHEQWVRQEREYEALLNARLKLQARLTTIRQEQKELEALLELAKSKEATVKAIKSLDDLAGVGDSDIARMGESIRGRLDKATAYSEMYATGLDNQMDDVLGTAEIDLQLEERKRRLGLSEDVETSEEAGEDAAEAASAA